MNDKENNKKCSSCHDCKDEHNKEKHTHECSTEHNHEHNHDICTHEHIHGCSCCGAKAKVNLTKSQKPDNFRFKLTIAQIAVSVAVLIVALVFSLAEINIDKRVLITLYAISYLAVGAEYIVKAIIGIFKLDFFNENMLMCIASIGAFIIGEYFESVAVMLFYTIGEMLQDIAVGKSKRNIAELVNLKADVCLKLVNGKTVEADCDELVIGDIVLVRQGEKVPSDGIVIEGNSSLDCSSMTGESLPVDVTTGDSVMGGVINLSEPIKVSITKAFADTQAAAIMNLIEDAQNNKPRSEKLISKFAAIYTPIVFGVAVLLTFIPPLFYDAYLTALVDIWLKKALAFLVISCPCALVISVPLAFFSGVGRCCKSGVLVKGGNYLEAMRSIDTVCFDKTGTITEGKFVVTDVVAVDNYSSENGAKQEKSEMNVDNEKVKHLLEIAYLCEYQSTHPISRSIIKFAGRTDEPKNVKCKEIVGKGVICECDGATYLAGNDKLLNESGVSIVHKCTDKTAVYIAENGKYLGYIALSDKIKEGAKETVAALKARGMRVIMLTGDVPEKAKAVAEEVGIEEVHASLLPEDKYRIVSELKGEGRKVMFIGDGMNDAPALKSAMLGVSVGSLGNDAAVEASDIVLSSGGIDGLTDAFKTSEVVKRKVTQNIIISLGVKFLIMIYSLIFNPIMWLAVIADVGVCVVAILNATAMRKSENLRSSDDKISA